MLGTDSDPSRWDALQAVLPYRGQWEFLACPVLASVQVFGIPTAIVYTYLAAQGILFCERKLLFNLGSSILHTIKAGRITLFSLISFVSLWSYSQRVSFCLDSV